jgi:Uma2 family endonuclease
MTVAEFTAWDDGTTTRYELAHGTPVAMAPPSGRHAEIVGNLSAALAGRLMRPCRVPQGGGVARADGDDEFRLPDLFVTCEPTPPAYFREPRLVIEVLSPSTERDDRTDKLDFYQSLPSVEAVLLIWQERRRVQFQLRTGDRWVSQDLIGAGTLALPSLELSFTLDEIYRGLDLPSEAHG